MNRLYSSSLFYDEPINWDCKNTGDKEKDEELKKQIQENNPKYIIEYYNYIIDHSD